MVTMEMNHVNEDGDEKRERESVNGNSSDGPDDPSSSACCDLRNPSFFTIEPHLLKYKSFYFWFSGAIGSLFPYFAVYFKQLGFSPNQIGIISGSRPLLGFCSAPIWGSFADWFRIRRFMLCCSTFGWFVITSSIGFVPTAPFADDKCGLVHEFMGASINGSLNLSQPSVSPKTREEFEKEHQPRPGVSVEENLLASRGWMVNSEEFHRMFTIIICLVVFGEFLQSPAGALADTGCIEALGDNDMHKYGHQRAWGSVGHGIFSLISGTLISLSRKDILACGITVTVSNYRIAFYFFAGCMACCFLTTLTFKFKKQRDDDDKPKPNPLKVFRMFLTLHFGSWLFCILFTGICNGVIWSFLFWHLENIGGTQLLLGVASGVSLSAEMLTFFFVLRLVKRFGCFTILLVGLAGYTVRFMVFALIKNPWLVLPFEVLQGATFSGVWCVYITYLSSSVPSEYLGTLQGFLHGVYWGLGTGTGSMIGGLLVEYYGARATFWIFSVASFINMLMFVIIQKVAVKPNPFDNYEELVDDKQT